MTEKKKEIQKKMLSTGLTKIVATLGPATSTYETIDDLVAAGVSVFRLNCSHGDKEVHKANVGRIRFAEEKFKRPLCVMCDLQGPKLRVGVFQNERITLKKGDSFRLDRSTEPGDYSRVELPHPEIFQAMHEGMLILLNDGQIKLKVKSFGKDYADTEVITGGELSNRKGVNVPGTQLPISAITEKDKRDLQMALDIGTDWIALSFVQRPEDVFQAREMIGGKALIMVKIEKPQALDCLDEIVEAADGVMVARGDLGVEEPIEIVPTLQKRIIGCCRIHGKPVVVATQMLESMITKPTPTRAEVSDIATAVFDGADGVMLSAETAVGAYPCEAVSIMRKTINAVQSSEDYARHLEFPVPNKEQPIFAAVAAIKEASLILSNVKLIVTSSLTGHVAFSSARARFPVPVLTLTSDINVARRITMGFGLFPKVMKQLPDLHNASQMAMEEGKKFMTLNPGEHIIVSSGNNDVSRLSIETVK